MPLTPITAAPPIASPPASDPAPPPRAAASPAAAPPAAWLENPDPQIDPGLNIVVLEFHDSAGRITRTIPSEQVIAAYRLHGVPGR